MPSINHNLWTAFKVCYICVFLLIPEVKSGSSKDASIRTDQLVDSSEFSKVIQNYSSPTLSPSMDSEKTLYPEKSPDSETNSDFEKNLDIGQKNHDFQTNSDSKKKPNPEKSPDSARNPNFLKNTNFLINPDLQKTPDFLTNLDSEENPNPEKSPEYDKNPDLQKNSDFLTNLDSEKNPKPEKSPDFEKNPDFQKNPDSQTNPDSEKNPDSDINPDDPAFIKNIKKIDIDLHDPFVQEITRVGSDEEDMIELNNLDRRKKFLWFEYGKRESGEARFRTLHGKNYNPYDFDENDKLHLNQYDDKLMSKIEQHMEKVKTKSELKSAVSNSKIEDSLKQQPNSDHEESLQKSSSTAYQQIPNELPISSDQAARMKDPDNEASNKKSTTDNKVNIQNSHMSENQFSQSSTIPEPQKKINEEEPKTPKKAKKKRRGRKVEDSLMLEFAHNRPDSRILWLDYTRRFTDKYRLIDEEAERTLITANEYGFVNTDEDPMKVAERFITYIENNRIGYEVLEGRITPVWNKKPPQVRAETCEYLINDNMMLRKYEFIYDSSQPPKVIQAHVVTIHLKMVGIGPLMLGALSCPVIQPNTSLIATLFMTPITYENEDTDEYVFTFVEEDPINHPLHVSLMFLSRLANGKSVEDEFVENQQINAMNDRWMYGTISGSDPKATSKGDKPTSTADDLVLKNNK